MREKILAIIEKNSRIDLADLAALLGESEAAVANEIADMEKENIIWTVPEVAKYLGCNISSIRKLVRNGQIPVWKIREQT